MLLVVADVLFLFLSEMDKYSQRYLIVKILHQIGGPCALRVDSKVWTGKKSARSDFPGRKKSHVRPPFDAGKFDRL